MKTWKLILTTSICGILISGCSNDSAGQADAAPQTQSEPTQEPATNYVAKFEETTFQGQLPTGGVITIKIPVEEMALASEVREAAKVYPLTYMKVELDNIEGSDGYFLDDVYVTTDSGEEMLFEHHLSEYNLWLPDLDETTHEWRWSDGTLATEREVDDHAYKIRTLNDSNDDSDRRVEPMQMRDLTLSAQFDQPVNEVVKIEAISSDREVTLLEPVVTK
ncbi:hypothetical protein ACT4S2_17820 [Kocuria turfanensis]|uniref:hypothetical protein n=1 Tax=Kocuria turfanensis TaxID=388357 RepID=UPI0040369E13